MMNKHNFFITKDDNVENLNGIKGRCKLWWLKNNKNFRLKSSYKWKNNTRMEKKTLKTNV
jgi:hypothetical protein